ncbi:type I pullulanase [Lactiplantibacillus plantarum]|uniref:type I pullulanase n=1 Tax=Lactiplantibacillus plantarum TaxID=1590 RepID=UPI002017E53E|nr:type I pullulanase [Lactiplantibacillus plantarum]UQN23965.1 type I pullulanase [Lactiplantibacillus plantarum]
MQTKEVVQKNWRMWKHGKQWLFSASAMLGLAVGAGLSGMVANADTTVTAANTPTSSVVENVSVKPATAQPTTVPTVAPPTAPTAAPTTAPTVAPTIAPTTAPTTALTTAPTAAPTTAPNVAPTTAPTAAPTTAPTVAPTIAPTTAPTTAPTAAPTTAPNVAPTTAPTAAPTTAPTVAPTIAPPTAPTVAPTTAPTAAPTTAPTVAPTTAPTAAAPTAPTVNRTAKIQATAAVAAVPTAKVAPTATSVAPVKDSTKVVIHYAGDGTKWVPYVWGAKHNGNGQQYSWTGSDSYGNYADIDLGQNYQQVGILLKGTDSWDKDGAGENRMATVDDSGKAEVWYQAGSDDAQAVTPTFDSATVNVHYHSKVANGVSAYQIWTDQTAKQTVNLDQTDAYGNQLGTVALTGKAFSKVYVQTVGADAIVREFTPLPDNQGTDIYLVADDSQAYYTPSFALATETVTSAAMNTDHELTVTVGKKLTVTEAKQQITVGNNQVASLTAVTPDSDGLSKTFTVTTTNPIDILQNNTVAFDGNAKAVDIGNYVRSQAFDDKYYYAGDDLGATYTENRTQIKLWAPTANQVTLRLYASTTNDATATSVMTMTRGDKGVWTSVLDGNYQGWAYDYALQFGDGTTTTTDDPYSKAVTVNGNRSVIEDVNAVQPTDFNRMPTFSNPTDAVIYETSVRDFTKDANSGVTDKGKFLGMVESGTQTASGQVTGLDYLKDLGVTHVQLMPMYDFSSIDETSSNPSYNWGYDPKNYDVPEGSYSTDATNPTTRIMEMKEMINGFHKAGIRVIMDVVYNHVCSMDEQAFQKVVPGYYFQYDADGHATNGTGVGNDIASERKMVRKYILDSVKYWATEYNLDGFRFDLMGILDVDTMNAIRAELNAIDPGILVYGEGWDMRATDKEIGAAQYNADKVDKNVGFFSSDIRNAIKGSEFGGINPGLVEGNTKEATYDNDAQAFVAGFLGGQGYADATTSHPYQAPSQTINYVACHDNRTLFDMLKALMPDESEANLIKRDKLATSMAILAQGVPFINAGQEALRTKDGNDNSYNSSDAINDIDWNRVQANAELVNYFKSLLNLRKSENVFRLNDYDQIKQTIKVLKSSEDGIFAFEYAAGGHKLYVLFNVNDHAVNFDAVNLGLGRILLSSDTTTKLGSMTTLAGLSTLVVRENLPQTVTINYCDAQGQIVKTTTVTLIKSGDQVVLSAPTDYRMIGGESAVTYDDDSTATTWTLNVPVEKVATTNPDDNGGTTTNPDNGGTTTNPDNNGNTTNPDNGGSTTNPDNNGTTTNLDNDGNTTNPDSNGNTANSDNGGNTANSDNNGKTTTTPDNGDNANDSTENGDDVTNPAETAAVTPIEDGQVTVTAPAVNGDHTTGTTSSVDNQVVTPTIAKATVKSATAQVTPVKAVLGSHVLPQTDETPAKPATLLGSLLLMAAGVLGAVAPKRKRD